MGHAIGRALVARGFKVVTNLSQRSEGTRSRADRAHIVDLGSLDAVVDVAEVILSVIPPAEARTQGQRLAAAIRRTKSRTLVADCNAIAPRTSIAIGELIAAAGADYVDASIIGRPPDGSGRITRIYVSGARAAEMLELRVPGLDVCDLGRTVGAASGLKMCYAAVTKGLTALMTEQRMAAAAMGISDALLSELQTSQPALLAWAGDMLPDVRLKSVRWVGEMEEIAAAFEQVGVPPGMALAAAELFRIAAAAPSPPVGRAE